jgi:uncharacterized membrane protein (UPF0127 family)
MNLITVRRTLSRLMLGLAVTWAFAGIPSDLQIAPAFAQTLLQPHEPFNPAKAQSLATSPLIIESGGKTFKFTVELADTDQEMEIGLMHRNTLAADRGMLFNYHEDHRGVSFWMRNTFIPLDMLFIRSNGQVVSIAENAVPHSEKPIGPNPPQAVMAVLEVPGGTAARLGLGPGTIVHHAIFKNMTP